MPQTEGGVAPLKLTALRGFTLEELEELKRPLLVVGHGKPRAALVPLEWFWKAKALMEKEAQSGQGSKILGGV